jgi:hypothetical protein
MQLFGKVGVKFIYKCLEVGTNVLKTEPLRPRSHGSTSVTNYRFAMVDCGGGFFTTAMANL